MKHTRRWLGAAFAAGAVALAAGAAFAQDKEVVFGLQCDRTGATQTVGIFLCPGYHDYIALLNSKGGIEGYKIRVVEIDHGYGFTTRYAHLSKILVKAGVPVTLHEQLESICRQCGSPTTSLAIGQDFGCCPAWTAARSRESGRSSRSPAGIAPFDFTLSLCSMQK